MVELTKINSKTFMYVDRSMYRCMLCVKKKTYTKGCKTNNLPF